MSDKVTIKMLSGKYLNVIVDSLKDVSDGYHTVDELYDHRGSLFILLCLQMQGQVYYKLDSTSPGWFILYLETKYGQISYYFKDAFLPAIQNVAIYDAEHVWDGHTSKDVLDRMNCLIADASASIGPVI
jgi:hypothetical protein